MAYSYDADLLISANKLRDSILSKTHVRLVNAFPDEASLLHFRPVTVRKMVGDAPSTGSTRSSASVLYPHFYDKDSQGNAPIAIRLLQAAIGDIDDAIDAYRDANMSGLWAKVSMVADSLNKAHDFTDFNEAFGAVVSHAARAATHSEIDSINRDALYALQIALKEAVNDPALTLIKAVDIIDNLEKAGWKVSAPEVQKLASELLAYFGISEADSATHENAAVLPQGELNI